MFEQLQEKQSGLVFALKILALLAILITWIGTAFLISRSIRVTEGTLTVDGSDLVGPNQDQVIHLDRPHIVEMAASGKRAVLALIGDKVRLNAYYRNQMARLTVDGLTRQALSKSFPARYYVAERDLEKPEDGTMWLDMADPGRRAFVEALLSVLQQNREHNFRYQQFAKLPWELKPAPLYGPFVGVEFGPGVEPDAFFGILADSEEVTIEGAIGEAYGKVVLWLDDCVGITPDYVIVHKKPVGNKGHVFSLLPLGRHQLRVRRETYSAHGGGGTVIGSPTSTRYPRLLFEVSGQPEELDVIFHERYDEDVTDDIEAAVEFINRKLIPERIPSVEIPAARG